MDMGDVSGMLQEPGLDGETEAGSLLHLTCHSPRPSDCLFTIQINFYNAINAS